MTSTIFTIQGHVIVFEFLLIKNYRELSKPVCSLVSRTALEITFHNVQ